MLASTRKPVKIRQQEPTAQAFHVVIADVKVLQAEEMAERRCPG